MAGSETELTEDLAKLLAPMKVGEYTQVIPMGGGFEIFKLESAIVSTTLSFDEARSRIADKLANERQDEAMHAYIKKLRSQALIEWKNDEIKSV